MARTTTLVANQGPPGDAKALLVPVVEAAASIDDAAFIDILISAGTPEDYARELASIFHPVREGWTATVTDAVPLLTGKAPRSLEAYARDNVAALKA